METSLEKLFVAVFRLYNQQGYYPFTSFLFATSMEEACEKAKRDMSTKLKSDTDRPAWILQYVEQVPEQSVIKAYNNLMCAESVVSISLDGNQWCTLLGEDLQQGVAGFGDTIPESLRNLADIIEKQIK